MRIDDFNKVLRKSLRIVDIGIKKGYFKDKDKKELIKKLVKVLKNGIAKDIEGRAIYGVYSSRQQRLYYNAKVFKNEQEALIYVLHEMKHALDDNEESIGFDSKQDNKGVGINEGATHRFATNLAEEILEEQIPQKLQTSLGITLNTNLDEYQIEDKMNELLCMALEISQAEFLRIQNQSDGKGLAKLKEMFDKYADFDTFQNALDGIYSLQEETWIDKNGNMLEEEAKPTKEQTDRAKALIRICQEQILRYIEKSNPERLEEIKENMIMIDGELMNDIEMLYQEDYLKYQEFITKGMDLSDSTLVYVSGLGGCPFEPLYSGDTETCIRNLLNNSEKPFTETVYIRKGDTYLKIDVTFDSNGVITSSEPQPLENLDSIIEGLEHSEIIGNAEEYIKILQQRGEKEKADIIQRKYEYFMNNRDRIPEIKIDMSKPRHSEIDDIAEMYANGELDGMPIDMDFSAIERGAIKYQGITITSDGLSLEFNEYGEITIKPVSRDTIRGIEDAVKSGEISLSEEQRSTLLKAKENIEKEGQIQQQDLEEVAENSQEEMKQTLRDLRMATQEREQPEQSHNEEGEEYGN